jgi:hypothetical protein
MHTLVHYQQGMAQKHVSTMKNHDEQDNYELSPLGLKYRAELLDILRASDSDLNAAIAALDRYLDQSPPPAFQKALLAWKGRFYLEHHRHEDAVRVLRVSDALPGQCDLANANTKLDLATALELSGDPGGALAVLIAALEEIDELGLLIKFLREVARVASSSDPTVPPRAEAALSRVKELYGVDDSPSAGFAAEVVRVADVLQHDWVRFSMLRDALKEAEHQAHKVRLIEEYLARVTVPQYRQLAEDLLQQVRDETEKAT